MSDTTDTEKILDDILNGLGSLAKKYQDLATNKNTSLAFDKQGNCDVKINFSDQENHLIKIPNELIQALKQTKDYQHHIQEGYLNKNGFTPKILKEQNLDFDAKAKECENALSPDEKAQLKESVLKQEIIKRIAIPVIEKRRETKSLETAQKNNLINNSEIPADAGYCSRAILATFYELKYKTGYFDWLPDNPQDIAYPHNFIAHMAERYPEHVYNVGIDIRFSSDDPKQFAEGKEKIAKTNPTSMQETTIREALLSGKLRKGALVYINNDQAEPNHGGHFHAMIYRGENSPEGPILTQFNPDAHEFPLKNNKYGGYIIDLPAILQQEQSRQIEEKTHRSSTHKNGEVLTSQSDKTDILTPLKNKNGNPFYITLIKHTNNR